MIRLPPDFIDILEDDEFPSWMDELAKNMMTTYEKILLEIASQTINEE